MPTEKTTPLSGDEKAIANIARAFFGTEADNRMYRSFNPKTNAIGYYQYLPFYHLDRMREFARTDAKGKLLADYTKIPTLKEYKANRTAWEKSGKIESYFEEIMKSQSFQDEFFKHDMKTVKLRDAKNLYNKFGKETGFSLEGMVGLVHIMGEEGARKRLTQARTNPKVLNEPIDAGNQISPKGYVGKIQGKIAQNGGAIQRPTSYKADGTAVVGPNLELEALQKRYKEIFNSSLDEKGISEALNNLYTEIGTKGYKQDFEAFRIKENEALVKQAEKFKNGSTPGALVHNILQDKGTQYITNPDGTWTMRFFGDNAQAQADKLREQVDNENYNMSIAQRNSAITGGIKPVSATIIPPITNIIKGWWKHYGKDFQAIKNAWNSAVNPEEYYKTLTKSQQKILKEGEEKTGQKWYDKPTFVEVTGDNPGALISSAEAAVYNETGQRVYSKQDADGKYYLTSMDEAKANAQKVFTDHKVKLMPEIDYSQYPDPPVVEQAAEEVDLPINPTIAEKAVTEKQALADANNAKVKSEGDEYFNRFTAPVERLTPDSFEYNESGYKKEVPWSAIGQGGLALIGMADASTELPMRDEQVSEAIMNYSRQLKKLSEMGLRPEEEAKMKSDIAGAYQEGLTQITRASNGNRNIVLGNLNGLNKNRLDAMGQMALMDMQQKNMAYEKYGKTLEYIDNFNNTRNIANHEIKYNAAKEKRQAGAALASGAFANMLEEIQRQRENGPGSANHRLQEAMFYKLTNVNAGIKDNGRGDTKGTKSYNDRMIKESALAGAQEQSVHNLNMKAKAAWESLSMEQKNEISKNGGPAKFTQDFIKANTPQPQSVFNKMLNTPATERPNLGLEEVYRNLPVNTGAFTKGLTGNPFEGLIEGNLEEGNPNALLYNSLNNS